MLLFAAGEGESNQNDFIFFFYFLAKRYLLTDNIVKLKEFQHKKIAIAYNLPGTKGNICFINSLIVCHSYFSFVSIHSFKTYLIERKKTE